MAKYKRSDYKQSLMIAVSLEDQLIPGTLEFAIHTLVESRMDMSVFDGTYQNDETGRSAYDLKILLKVVLLGYSRGLISTRAIEGACSENVFFMAMLCNLQSNVTDNESAKMKSSRGTIQGYNGQALVDKKHQAIVHAQAFGNAHDHQHLAPMIDAAKDNLKKIGESEDYFKDTIFTADTNYHNQSNLKKCQEEKLEAYIPDLKFRSRDPRFATQPRYQAKKGKKFILADFKYGSQKDHYICPNGKVLKLNVKKHIQD